MSARIPVVRRNKLLVQMRKCLLLKTKNNSEKFDSFMLGTSHIQVTKLLEMTSELISLKVFGSQSCYCRGQGTAFLHLIVAFYEIILDLLVSLNMQMMALTR